MCQLVLLKSSLVAQTQKINTLHSVCQQLLKQVIYAKSVQQYVKRTRLLVTYRLQPIPHKEVSYEIEVTPAGSVLNRAAQVAPFNLQLVNGSSCWWVYVLQDNWIITIAPPLATPTFVVSRSQTPFHRIILPCEMGSGEQPLMSLCAA